MSRAISRPLAGSFCLTVACCLLLGMGLVMSSGRACAEKTDTRTLTPDYSNKFYRKAAVPAHNIVIGRVDDLRGVTPETLGTTLVGLFSVRHVPLVMSEPVSDFVRRSLDTLLLPAQQTDTVLQLDIGVEAFELGCTTKRALLLFKEVDTTFVRSRFRVDVVNGAEKRAVGTIENIEYGHPEFASPLTSQKSEMYKGIVAVARGLATGALPLSYEAAADQTAGPRALSQPTVRVYYKKPPGPPPPGYFSATGTYFGFESEPMKQSYNHSWGVMLSHQGWGTGQYGFRAGIGYTQAAGQPRPNNPMWEVTNPELRMYTVPLEATYLRRFGQSDQSGRFFPYGGLGLSAFLSMERISASGAVSDGGWFMNFDAAATGFGLSGGAHALLGTEIRIAGSLHALLEVKGTLSTGGAPWLLQIGDVGKSGRETLDATLFDAVKMSNLNFSGWSVQMGFINLDRNAD